MKAIENPDLSNTDPKYWDKVLKSHNLSLYRGDSAGQNDTTDDVRGLNFESDIEGYISEFAPVEVSAPDWGSKKLPGLDQYVDANGDICDEGEGNGR